MISFDVPCCLSFFFADKESVYCKEVGSSVMDSTAFVFSLGWGGHDESHGEGKQVGSSGVCFDTCRARVPTLVDGGNWVCVFV